jgi:histidine ammonia-lyase
VTAGAHDDTTPLEVGANPVDPARLAKFARHPRPVYLSPDARDRMRRSADAAADIATRRPVYGRTTGVGARRDTAADTDGRAHALRLWRSHVGGGSATLSAEEVNALLLARLAQLATGGSGARPELAYALAEMLNGGVTPRIVDMGGVGTGDIAVLAQVGLALAGEGVDVAGRPMQALFPPSRDDALPLLSSNAAALAVATLAWDTARRLAAAAPALAALSFVALGGNAEAYDAAVAESRPLPGTEQVAARLRGYLADETGAPARIQDPYGLRAVPQVEGALWHTLAALENMLAIELAASAENPLIVPARDLVLHNANFHAVHVALALDTARLALTSAAGLSQARLTMLMEPGYTGLEPFLADGEAASSGVLIVEYVVADAMSRLRLAATPATWAEVRLSRGVEDHASGAWQAALRTRDAVAHARVVYAAELVAAVRALAMIGRRPATPALDTLLKRAEVALSHDTHDRPLAADIRAAEDLLHELVAPDDGPSHSV